MDGTYAEGTSDAKAWGPLTYSQSNALAITPASLQGKWSSSNSSYAMSFEFDAKGVFTGATSGAQLGLCNLSGSLVQTTPNSSRNMFQLTMSVVNAASGSDTPCRLNVTNAYQGLAAIVLTPVGVFVKDGYYRNIAFHMRTGNNTAFFTNTLRKEIQN